MKRDNQSYIVILGILVIIILVTVYVISKNSSDKNVDSLGENLVAPKYDVETAYFNYYEDSWGYLAEPTTVSTEKYPGVVMIHEWWGLNENIEQMAENLASQGYIVLAVDLYGEVAETPDEARVLATSVRENPEEAIKNMKAAVGFLENYKTTTIASLGWCFGGQQSLQLSLNEDVDATVIYYGNLVTDKNELSKIQSPVLGIFGSEDNSIPVSTVNEFESALDEVGIENEIYIYDGVGHAFANPSGTNYAPKETKDAWIKTLDFLERNLK